LFRIAQILVGQNFRRRVIPTESRPRGHQRDSLLLHYGRV
jgi:hypothetical protein